MRANKKRANDAGHLAENHWANVSERGSDRAIAALLWVYRHLGRGLMFICLYPAVIYFFLTGREARRHSRRYLQRVYETSTKRGVLPAVPTRPTRWLMFKHFLAFADSAFDRAAVWMGHISRDEVIFSNRSVLVEQLQSGRGAVLIGSHLGNLEMCRGLVDQAPGIVMNVLVLSRNAEKISTALKKINPRVDYELIQVDEVGPDTAILLQEKISRGECVVVMGDRLSPNANSKTISSDVHGKSARFPQGPFVLAALLGCPVFFIFCLKQKSKYHIYLKHYADVLKLPRNDREKGLQDIVDAYVDNLEMHSTREPLQWFNFFDFWEEDKSV